MNVQTDQELAALRLALIGGQGCLSAAKKYVREQWPLLKQERA